MGQTYRKEDKTEVKEIIDNNIAYLVDNIEVKTNIFWEKLIEAGLYTGHDVNNIRVSISLFIKRCLASIMVIMI